MSVIFHIMKEEYERLLEVIPLYEEEVAKEAQGCPRIKRIGKNHYLYLVKRSGPKVVYQYVGDVESEKANEVFESLERRKNYEKSLKKAKADLKDVKKVLRGKI
jgi:hypothetical protein